MAADTMPKVYCTYCKNHFKIFHNIPSKESCILHFMNSMGMTLKYSLLHCLVTSIWRAENQTSPWVKQKQIKRLEIRQGHTQAINMEVLMLSSLSRPPSTKSSFLHSRPVQNHVISISLNHLDKTIHTGRHPSTACYSCMNRDLIMDALNHQPLNIRGEY